MKNPKKTPVLCVERRALPEHLQVTTTSLVPLQLSDFTYEQTSFINREIVDAKRAEKPTYFSIGVMFPQLLPYVVVKSGNEVLIYNRKGSEDRLHGMVSLGVGGHIDIEDATIGCDEEEIQMDVAATIVGSCERELEEEAGLLLSQIPELYFNHALLSSDDEVGQVHIGLIAVIDVPKEHVVPGKELRNARWVPISELHAMIGECENWSQILINNLEELKNDIS